MGIKSLTARLLSPRMFNYANNRLTIAGIVLTTISAVVITVFILVGLGGGLPNPYINIVGFMILPAFFILGLLLIPFGMWRRRRQLGRPTAQTAHEVAIGIGCLETADRHREHDHQQ